MLQSDASLYRDVLDDDCYDRLVEVSLKIIENSAQQTSSTRSANHPSPPLSSTQVELGKPSDLSVNQSTEANSNS
jgi:hypothetical protein